MNNNIENNNTQTENYLLDLKNFLLAITADEDIFNLESETKNLNILEIFKISNYEIRHSNILAWLLDANNKEHGLGDRFLKRLIRKIVTHYVNTKYMDEQKAINLLLADCENFTAKREENNKDILIVSDIDKIVIVIENKVKASEGTDQLYTYFEQITKKSPYKDYNQYFIFLTLNGDEPADDKNKKIWMPLDYDFIMKSLKSILIEFTPIDEVNIIIRHYVQTIEGLLYDKKIEDFYNDYKVAIDLLYEYNEQIKSKNNQNSDVDDSFLEIEEDRDFDNMNFEDEPVINDFCKRIYKKHKMIIDLIILKVKSKRNTEINPDVVNLTGKIFSEIIDIKEGEAPVGGQIYELKKIYKSDLFYYAKWSTKGQRFEIFSKEYSLKGFIKNNKIYPLLMSIYGSNSDKRYPAYFQIHFGENWENKEDYFKFEDNKWNFKIKEFNKHKLKYEKSFNRYCVNINNDGYFKNGYRGLIKDYMIEDKEGSSPYDRLLGEITSIVETAANKKYPLVDE